MQNAHDPVSKLAETDPGKHIYTYTAEQEVEVTGGDIIREGQMSSVPQSRRTLQGRYQWLFSLGGKEDICGISHSSYQTLGPRWVIAPVSTTCCRTLLPKAASAEAKVFIL